MSRSWGYVTSDQEIRMFGSLGVAVENKANEELPCSSVYSGINSHTLTEVLTVIGEKSKGEHCE